MPKKPDHAARSHARRFAPSASDRWMSCPGSVELTKDAPPDPTNEAAERGTAAHELLNVSLSSGRPPIKFKGKTFNKTFVADNAMCNAVEYATDYVRSRKPVKVWTEQELDIPATGEQGHVDIALIYDNVLEVIDYKNGAWVVEAKDNPQIRLYVLGVLFALTLTELGRGYLKKIKRIRVTIIQPNAYHVDGPVRSHLYRTADLEVFDQEVRQIVRSVEAGTAKLSAGPQCKYCPARARCKTLAEYATDQAKLDFKSVLEGKAAPKNPGLMTNANLGTLFTSLPILEAWIEAVKERVKQLIAKDPECVPGVKLVAGRSQRYWEDAGKAYEAFRKLGFRPDAIAPRKMIGIGDAESLLDTLVREEVMRSLTLKTQPPLSVVPNSDPRPRAGSDPKEDFKEFLL